MNYKTWSLSVDKRNDHISLKQQTRLQRPLLVEFGSERLSRFVLLRFSEARGRRLISPASPARPAEMYLPHTWAPAPGRASCWLSADLWGWGREGRSVLTWRRPHLEASSPECDRTLAAEKVISCSSKCFVWRTKCFCFVATKSKKTDYGRIRRHWIDH